MNAVDGKALKNVYLELLKEKVAIAEEGLTGDGGLYTFTFKSYIGEHIMSARKSGFYAA